MRTIIVRICAAGTCVAAFLAGCTARDLTGPGTRARDIVPADDPALLPMPDEAWTSFLAPPATSDPAAILGLQATEFGGVPDSTWVVVSVNGDIQQRWNPECDFRPPYWPCQSGAVVSPFATSPSDLGPVQLWGKQGDRLGVVRLRGSGDIGSAIGLYYFTAAGSIVGKVNATPKWAWDPSFGTGPFSYYLSGGYEVAVTAIRNPLRIADSGPVDSLGTRRYTVEPVSGLQFLNPAGWPPTSQAGDINWYFMQGDSVAESAGLAGSFIEVPACRGQQSCAFTPPGPGRMQAMAYVEAHYAGVRSANVCTVPDFPDGIEDEEDVPSANCGPLSRRCPRILGKVVTAGIAVAGRLHTFKFEGPFVRSTATSVPGTYAIGPTVSEDAWWIAESGTITVDCLGFYLPVRSGLRVWVGHATYRTGDLHMVMGPGNPDFH